MKIELEPFNFYMFLNELDDALALIKIKTKK